jgi:solute carrier family 25 carnitine/acylcarnitine transporter 20/29
MQVHPKRYSSLTKAAQDVYANRGMKSIYRGTTLTLCRDIPGSIAYFGVYVAFLQKGPPINQPQTFPR